MRDAARIENVAATVKAAAAARVADTGVWRGGGDRSAAHHVARTTGSSVGQAVEAIDAARRLESLPAVAAAARSGGLSAAQSAAVSAAVAADPAAEGRLLEACGRVSLAELRDECARVAAAAAPHGEARRARIHVRRSGRSYYAAAGAWQLRGSDNPEVGARFMAVLAPITDRLFRQARAEGRREPLEAYAADALATLAELAATAMAATAMAATAMAGGAGRG